MPKNPAFPPYRASDDQTTNLVQRQTRDAIRSTAENPIVQGNLVTVTLGTTKTLVSHRLGRPWRGWIVVDVNKAGTVYRDTTANADAGLYVALIASNNDTATTLWIF